MRIFVAGASGAIGTRLVAQLVDARARGGRHLHVARQRRARPRARGDAGRSSTCSTRARRAQGRRSRPRPDAIVHQATALADMTLLAGTSTAVFAHDEPAADRGHRRAAGRRARGRGDALRRAELRQRPLRARGRAGQDRGRPARSRPGARRCARATPRCATSTRRSRTPAASRCATAASTAPANDGHGRAGAQAAVPDRRRRRRRDLVHPPRRRRRGDRARARARRRRRSTTSSTTSPRPCASGCRCCAEVLGAKPPRHVPRWLARLVAGEAAVMMGTESRGASNAKAKRELGWRCATRAGARASPRSTALPVPPSDIKPRSRPRNTRTVA